MTQAPTAAQAEPPLPAAAPARPAPDAGTLGLLATGHAVTDSYGQSLLAPMLPMLREQLGIGLGPLMGLMTVMGLSGSLSQPILGWITDRWPRLCLVALGPLVASLFIGFIGYATGYWQLAALLFLAGLGISAFHPQGASLARRASGGSSTAMSLFTVGGNLGFGLAPLLGILYWRLFGLQHFYLAALPAVVFALVMAWVFYRREPGGVRRIRPAELDEGPDNVPALWGLTATVTVRATVQIGMTQLLPFLVAVRFAEAGDWIGGVVVSVLLLAGAAAGPIGGRLADRHGRWKVMTWSFVLAPWPLLIALHSPAWGLLAGLAAGSFILMLPHPSNVMMAQEYLPRRAGFAVSLITGLAWGLGHLFAPAIGLLADRVGVGPALTFLASAPLLGTIFMGLIPREKDLHLRPVLVR